MLEDINHPRTIHWFAHGRSQQLDAANHILNKMFVNGTADFKENLIALYADFKWGKRVVMEIMSLLKRSDQIKYYSFLAEKKNDMADQRQELAKYGIKTLPHTRKLLAIEINAIKKELAKNPDLRVIIFYDEGDLGDGIDQVYDNYIKPLLSYTKNIGIIAISATNFTVIDALAKQDKEDCIIVGDCSDTYTSIADFDCIGSEEAIGSLIIEDDMFDSDGEFTDHGKYAIMQWLNYEYNRITFEPHLPIKNNFIARSKFAKNKSFAFKRNVQRNINALCVDIFGKEQVDFEIVDQQNSSGFDWMRGDRWSTGWRLICVNKTFTRGTETDIQPFVYGYYDPSSSYVNTLAQRLGRFANYLGVRGIKFYLSAAGYAAINIHKSIKQELLAKTSWATIIEKLNLRLPGDERIIDFAQRLKAIGSSNSLKVSESPQDYEFYDDIVEGTDRKELEDNLKKTMCEQVIKANNNPKFQHHKPIDPRRLKKINNITWDDSSNKIKDTSWKKAKSVLSYDEVQKMKFQGLAEMGSMSHRHRFYICYDNEGKTHLCMMVHTGNKTVTTTANSVNNTSAHCNGTN